MKLKNFLYNLHPYLLASIASILTIAQITLAFFVRGESPETLQWVGWICIWISGIFGLVPIITFRRKGGVPEGESYVKTTVLVDSGIYAVVRHPQNGTAWLLINGGIILIAWHWTSAVLGLTSMCLVYTDTYKADQYCIEKFGGAYKEYIRKVPRVNFFTGFIKLLWSRGEETGDHSVNKE